VRQEIVNTELNLFVVRSKERRKEGRKEGRKEEGEEGGPATHSYRPNKETVMVKGRERRFITQPRTRYGKRHC
jgi:hypothetical protein